MEKIKKMIDKANDSIYMFQKSIHSGIGMPNNYINKPVFQIAFLIIICLVIADMSLNNWELKSYTLDCPQTARNGYCEINPANFDIIPLSMAQDIQRNGEYAKSNDPMCMVTASCTVFHVDAGYHYGRQDLLAEYGTAFIVIILVSAFAINHVLWKNRRREIDEN